MNLWEILPTAQQIAAAPIASHVAFVGFFGAVGLVADTACRLMGITRRETKIILVSSTTAYLHAIPMCIASYGLLSAKGWTWTGPWGGIDFTAPNSPQEIAAIVFCQSFMIYDTLSMWLQSSTEYLYQIHHVGVLIHMSLCLYVGRGGLSICLCALLGEMTNPVQNTWIIACALYDDYKASHRLRKLLTLATLFELSVARFFYIPLALIAVFCRAMLISPPQEAVDGIPLAVRGLWCFIPVAVVAGSALFVRGLLGDKGYWDEAEA
eukprot:CAMPEP_0169429574 /NCGR_PEP_ID=MMETSP1042-20121227/1937_1 /TAXON_ID=464988 /ORGANISM="Hemiselmis andersenii, Strain CCMP1180" /LENGTH=265 /DNA_ID=CAMNT_0009539829 /DNA_START=18 /DNA_END=812 /DNA_ORIENTATION=-